MIQKLIACLMIEVNHVFIFVEKGLSSTNNEKTSQERVIKQLAALRNQLSFEEQKVQTELDRNMVNSSNHILAP